MAALDTIARGAAALLSRRPWAVGAAILVLLLLVAGVVLQRFPNSGDEYAFVQQAQTYAMGKVAAPEPPAYDFFRQLRYLSKDGLWFAPYQAGWPFVMTALHTFGIPYWAINPLFGAAAAIAFWAVAKARMSEPAAAWATIALVTSAFFVLNFSSYFSHGLAALCTLAFILCADRFLRGGHAMWLVFAGLCVGLMGFSRAFNAVVFAAPFVAALLLRKDRFSSLALFAVGGAPFVALLAAFNQSLTGDPLILPTFWYSSSEPLGAPSGDTFLLSAVRFLLLHLWTSPVLLVAYAAALFLLVRRRALDFVDFIAPLTFVAFIFYGGDAGQQYGPRYLFEIFPLMLITAFKAADPFLFTARQGRAAAWAAAAVLTHAAFQIGFLAPRLAREHVVVSERMDVYRQAQQQSLSHAVVLIATNVGRVREMMPYDLLRNGPVVGDEPVIYAHNRGDENALLRAQFPDRAYYLYACGQLTPAPTDSTDDFEDNCPNTAPD
ncbi:MAG: hypothetical protein GC189_03610 [Alphaproteobacteria bacterium]|nr:hypothetical protein [Alphaproteobacteria bacterium]